MNATVLLFVEDSFFLQTLSGYLRRLKASIITANGKKEALEMCAGHEVDLALLDIREQGSDALQILASLKKNEPETEVILLSDPGNISLAMKGMLQGASDDITVPFDIDALRKKIKSALKRRKSRMKACRKPALLNVFEDAMVAATFAQAGEFETAQEIYRDRSNK